MKCVKNPITGEMFRLPDDLAYKHVRGQFKWQYISKKEFKAAKGIKVKVTGKGRILDGNFRAKVAEEMGIQVNPEIIN
jgi:hypothetical protein